MSGNCTVQYSTCCKCGALPNSLPFCLGGLDYDFHCFCCAKPPNLKCIQCNALRDIELHEKHGPCIGGKLHVFVYSQPWPPFPEITSNSQPDGQLTPGLLSPISFHQQTDLEDVEPEASSADVISLVAAHEDDDASNYDISDIKTEPKPLATDSYWVTAKQIGQWDHCPRCDIPRVKQAGWVKHAQKCGQDPKYKTRKFFIYIHTKSWCNYLVQDSSWNTHSNPETGACTVCRLARLNNHPLPYQPKPPPRPNEDHLARMRRYNRRKTKQKRRSHVDNVHQTADGPTP